MESDVTFPDGSPAGPAPECLTQAYSVWMASERERVISSVCLCHDSSDSSFFVLSLTVPPPASVFIF